jgi:hypothetical protein
VIRCPDFPVFAKMCMSGIYQECSVLAILTVNGSGSGSWSGVELENSMVAFRLYENTLSASSGFLCCQTASLTRFAAHSFMTVVISDLT